MEPLVKLIVGALSLIGGVIIGLFGFLLFSQTMDFFGIDEDNLGPIIISTSAALFSGIFTTRWIFKWTYKTKSIAPDDKKD